MAISDHDPVGLPVVGGPPPSPERADAARNRRLLLAAAKSLIDHHGASAVTMDAVARAAGVGKGTVFRRFGNRTGLMHALLDHSESDLQQAMLSGPEPLGPGGHPLDRLVAYGRARLKMTVDHLDLLLEANSDDPDRLAHPVWAMSTQHVKILLRQIGFSSGVDVIAHAVQAPIDAITVRHLMSVGGLTHEQIADDWEQMVRILAAGR
ncbi:TetR/AcrR family transcriptional regulator [Gordonia sp. HY002]|uniref:TetR/AcrR family transcriptional regulator n=1 Tax=Gordonia zhenghanii TaxID=2911516 RepID=UPI001EEFA720|nr:TetR/AcrR family transcriptional regulator [Gordonia zhenghanii]MCF8571434.1 TetR/AcrR family transcriptional regulator [Gordonia zhenghanii]MCF8607707.1 TetR/AcrR family transcriptional regulator [Gordonia zhenghanii]